MGDKRRAKCQRCHRHRDDVGELSWTGLCGDCGELLNRQAQSDQHFHQGPFFETWRRSMAACVGGVLLDETDTKA